MKTWKSESEIIADKFNNFLNDKKAKIEKLDVLTQEYVHISNNYNTRKNKVWLQTDFKKLGLTNDKQRTAYVEDSCKHAEIETIKRHLVYLDQCIELESILVELQGGV